jgi:hypothetical protein
MTEEHLVLEDQKVHQNVIKSNNELFTLIYLLALIMKNKINKQRMLRDNVKGRSSHARNDIYDDNDDDYKSI